MSASNGPWGCSWYAKSGLYIFLNRSGRCAAACDADILWSQKDKGLTEAWMAVFTTVCLVSVVIAIFILLKPRKQPVLTTIAGKISFLKLKHFHVKGQVIFLYCDTWILSFLTSWSLKVSSNATCGIDSSNVAFPRLSDWKFDLVIFYIIKITSACRTCNSLLDDLPCNSCNRLCDPTGRWSAERRLHACDSAAPAGANCPGPTATTVPHARRFS